MKFVFSVLGCFVSLIAFATIAYAQEKQFINVVNPVRITENSVNPALSLKSQYGVLSTFDLPATWLLTYEAMRDEGVRTVLKSFDAKQELGIFLEIDRKLAEEAGVTYNEGVSWHHASNIFLSGYTQGERIKLIDTVFEAFNELFGYYPKSVGSWWTDAYSLSYIQENYKVVANFGLADQYSILRTLMK